MEQEIPQPTYAKPIPTLPLELQLGDEARREGELAAVALSLISVALSLLVFWS